MNRTGAVHPTIKPVELIAADHLAHEAGELIYEPFRARAGLIAAEDGRRC